MSNSSGGCLCGTSLSRRDLLRVSAGIGAGVTLAGITSAASAQEQALPADAAAEQVLRVTTGATGWTFTPMRGGGDQQSWQTLIWAPPMYFDVDLNLKGGVFATAEGNAESTVWTFKIDPRARWSDGSPITATDVKGTWQIMTDPLTKHGRIVGYIGNVVGFDAVRNDPTADMEGLVALDELTLQVSLVNPDPIFHWRIATTHMNPVKADQARASVEEFWLPDNEPLVSGPYMLASFDPDRGEAELVKNPNWWMDEGPYLDSIQFRAVPDQQAVAALVQNGEIDACLQIPPDLRDAFPDLFTPIKFFGFDTYWMNFSNEPTSDPNVRKALIMSVNFDDVLQATLPGGVGAVPVKQILDPDLPCTDTANQWYPYDVEGAKAALAASTYGSAENLPKLRVSPRGQNPVHARAIESMMEFWRQNLGITNVEFQATPDGFGPDVDKLNVNRDDAITRFPDSATYMWSVAYSNGQFAKPAAEGAEAGATLDGYLNPQVDTLIEQALSTPIDDPQRCELALEAQRLFMADYPILPAAYGAQTLNARDYVKNYAKGPDVSLIEPWRIYIGQH